MKVECHMTIHAPYGKAANGGCLLVRQPRRPGAVRAYLRLMAPMASSVNLTNGYSQ